MKGERGRVRKGDPLTSVEAAEETDATALETKAWAALRKHGGWLTYFEWSKISGIKYASLTPRGKQLWLRGRVEREKRPGLNDLGKVKNLLHFHALAIPRISKEAADETRAAIRH
jgi:hypothetical protein